MLEIRYKQTIINVDKAGDQHDKAVLEAFASIIECYFKLTVTGKLIFFTNILIAMERSLKQIKGLNRDK